MAAAVSLCNVLDRQSADPDPDPEEIARELQAQGEAVASGDAALIRRAMAAQVTTLERLFHHFIQLAAEEKPGSDAHDRLSRLAMRAQMQSARTGTMLARLCQLMTKATTAEAQKTAKTPPSVLEDDGPDPFVSPQMAKKLANHTDPDINFYTKRPRVRFKFGSAAHDLFENATASEYFAEGLEELLNSKVPWPLDTSAAEYAREHAARRMAEAA